ncbi:hypothetical protein [Pseudobutyrivibrio sp. MD2005]|uniref:hypothetical protein n=1 Tax=Pseudobutyrivibrio sp. MD2005 TaxID=1410616 RepID=UPI0012DDB595|nr:hypothetical protein [Pseudobutyrivibrio sp. MD2005]
MQEKKNYFYTTFNRLSDSLLFACLFFFSLRYGYGIIDGPKFLPIIIALLIAKVVACGDGIGLFDFSFFVLFLGYFLIGLNQHILLEGQAEEYNVLAYAWTVPSVYLLGKVSVGNDKKYISRRVLLILLIISIGMYIQGLLNYYGYTMYCDLAYNDPDAIWRSFWDAATDGTRNNWNNGFIMIISALFYATIMRKKNKKLFWGILLATIFCVTLNLLFGGRTLPAMLILIYAFMACVYVLAHFKTFSIDTRIKFFIALTTIILFIVIFQQLFCENVLGIRDLYNNSFLSRNGGVINNVRLRMWILGISRAFYLKKGGWDLSDINSLPTVHNTWIEYARYYDIIVFLLIVVFILLTLVCGIRIVFKNGNQYPILYFAFASEIAMFIFGMYEPIYIQNHDLTLFFFFVCGLISGIQNVIESPKNFRINCVRVSNRKRYLFFGLGLLTMALISSSYVDWWNNRLSLLMPFVIPVCGYLLGGVLNRKKYQFAILIIVGILSTLIVINMYRLSINSEFYKFGLYTEILTGNTVDKSVFEALWIIPISIIVGILLYTTRMSKIIVALLSTTCIGILFASRIQDGRLVFIKEALRMQLGMKTGLQWIASKENYLGIRTSHCMWLDFARDYGMVVFGLLFAFELWSLYCFCKMVCHKDKYVTEYILIIAFILYNYQFMFESSAITSKYIFSLGLMIYGMICADIAYNDVFESDIKIINIRDSFKAIKIRYIYPVSGNYLMFKKKIIGISIVILLTIGLFIGTGMSIHKLLNDDNRLKRSNIIIGNITLAEYLNKIGEMDCTAIIAVKDIAAPYVDEQDLEAFRALGFDGMEFSTETNYNSFIGIYSRGEVEYQEIGGDNAISYETQINNHDVNVKSATYNTGNTVDIIIDGEQYAVKWRGFNIVLVDNQNDELIDSITYDVFAPDVPIYRLMYDDVIYITKTR